MKKRTFIKTSAIATAGIVLFPSLACESEKTGATAASAQLMAGTNGFELPDLPYDYNALEPNIDARTMEIHHSKHHAGYVRKLNNALQDMDVSGKSLEDILGGIDGKNSGVRNNGGGHYNHSLFWKVMSGGESTKPSEKLLKAIEGAFSSYDSMVEAFSKLAATRFGSGWAWLAVNAEGQLYATSTPNQDNPLMKNVVEKPGTPILGIDVWEHAYYLNYQNKRGDYIKNWWNVVNWEEVSKNYEGALAVMSK